MKTLKELEQEYNKKKDQYETALTAVAHAGSNKVEVQRAAAILDILLITKLIATRTFKLNCIHN